MRINKDKRIGRVLFIVEGSRYEFSLLKQIFCSLLHYEYVEKRRDCPDRFISGKDKYSKIAVVNTKESNIKDITDNDRYLDAIFDRDPKSNTDSERIREYILTLKDPYENEDAIRAGQLLLSYPSIESYIISGFESECYNINLLIGKDAKNYIAERPYIQMNKISEETLFAATNEFVKYLKNQKLELELDNFAEQSLKIFENQEKNYAENGFKLFSMLTLAFLQMGIMEI